MTYQIAVQKHSNSIHDENPNLSVQDFNQLEDFQTVLNLCVNQRRIYWLESLLIPVRTNNLSVFCQDFFLPGFFHLALKTKDLSLKILFCLIAPFFDLISLPIRLITVIPRCIYNANHTKESHPFYRYLIDRGVAAEDLKEGYVYLKTTRLEEPIGGVSRYRDGVGETFNFIQLPSSISSIRYTQLTIGNSI